MGKVKILLDAKRVGGNSHMVAKAKESYNIEKARRKLKKQMDGEHARINVQALQKMTKAIEHWIDRHKSDRISLKDKSIHLFDENKHTAIPKNKYITNLITSLKGSPSSVKPGKTPLKGRVKSS